MIKSAKETALHEVCNHPNWFTQSETILSEPITRNLTHKPYAKMNTKVSHKTLKVTRRDVQKEKRKAKRWWQLHFTENIKREDFKTHPKSTWEIVFKLIEGFQGHHRMYKPKAFKDQWGKIATNNKENMNTLGTHYHAIFNRRANIDYSVLKEIKQCDNSPELGTAPTPNEILSALKHMKNNKAPSFLEVTTDMLKNLPINSVLLLTDFFHEYWNHLEIDYESWHKVQTTGKVSA